MPRFKHLLTVEEAKDVFNDLASKLKPAIVEIPVLQALNRYAAMDVMAPMDVPPFNRASMDGFAVVAEDTHGAREDTPVELPVTGSITPGNPPGRITKGEAVEIATGSVMPEGADAVVMVEYCEVIAGTVHIKRAGRKGENIMQAGSDIPSGSLVIEKGTKLDSRKIGLLSSIGMESVKVFDLNVGILSTGDEIIEPSSPLEPGKIYDVNSFTIYTSLLEEGVSPKLLGIVGDEYHALKSQILRGIDTCDILITSGATSAGKGDNLYKIVEEEGELLFHGVQIKPGKPILAGIIKKKPIIGLPGYPTSALITFYEFVIPMLLKAMNARYRRLELKGKLVRRVVSEGRRQLYPVFLVRDLIFPVDKGSGAITSLTEANGYIEINEGEEVINRGEERTVKMLSTEVADLLYIGEDPIYLLDMDMAVKKVVKTSDQGIMAILRDTADFSIADLNIAQRRAKEHLAGELVIPWGVVNLDADRRISWNKKTALGMEVQDEVGEFEVTDHYRMAHYLSHIRAKSPALLPFARKFGLKCTPLGEVRYGILINNNRLDDRAIRELIRYLKSYEERDDIHIIIH
jgi:molybdenum cofactor synthesis domain-containing protein